MADKKPDEPEKGTDLGEVETPEPIAAEDAVGAQETPSEEQQEREQALVEEPVAEAPAAPAAEAPAAPAAEEDLEEDEPETPRVKPEIPGMDLVPDIVLDGEDRDEGDEDGERDESDEDELPQPIADASIDLAAGARYRATGKRKTAVARVILKPGTGEYVINGKPLDVYFPRATLMKNIRQPLETVGYEDKMDVVATMHGGGVSSQAGALRHGISRALLEADPNLRGELKRRGFLTRDARAKERKKAGLKKARKRPQFSKR
jgi:small subunit ribosomal protein S9